MTRPIGTGGASIRSAARRRRQIRRSPRSRRRRQSGPAPLAVTFTDGSTNLPTSWAWDFDNNGSVDSTAKNPVHTYATPGTYSVKLTASNSAGSDDEIKTGFVTVGAPLTFVTFTPGADAFVSSTSPTKNYGSDVVLRVRASSTNYRSYLMFTASGLDGPVKSAHLRLFVHDASPDGGSVYAVGNGWTETGINWNNAPVLPGSAIRSIGATPPVGSWVDVDLGTAITGNGTYSFAIANNNTNSAYYSSRQGTNPPQLILGYEAGGTPEIAPVAAFSATPTSGPAPLSVTFSDASTNQPTSWAWDFQNDGTVDSTAQNPVFAYGTDGTYSVKLTASNGAGSDDEIKVDYVTVATTPPPEIAPVAAFSATPTSGPAPLSVTFSDASTNQPTSWAWDFQNDGTVDSTTQNPIFAYSTAGTYSVKLTAANGAGSDDEVKVGYVVVGTTPPGGGTITVTPTADSRTSQAIPREQLRRRRIPAGSPRPDRRPTGATFASRLRASPGRSAR